MIISTSTEGFCARGVDCFLINAKDKKSKQRGHVWLKKHRLFIGDCGSQKRVFALVGVIHGERVKAYFMDAITGSLYDGRTKHAPSSLLSVSNLVRDQKAASQLLANWIPAWRDDE